MKLIEALTRNYHEMHSNISTKLNLPLLPKLGEDCSPADVCVLVSTLFSSSHGGDYRPALRTVASLKGYTISEEDLETVYPDIRKFLDWLIPHLNKEL